MFNKIVCNNVQRKDMTNIDLQVSCLLSIHQDDTCGLQMYSSEVAFYGQTLHLLYNNITHTALAPFKLLQFSTTEQQDKTVSVILLTLCLGRDTPSECKSSGW